MFKPICKGVSTLLYLRLVATLCDFLRPNMAEKCKPIANQNQDGFRFYHRPERSKKPFYLQWNVAAPGEPRKLRTLSFATDQERRVKFEELKALKQEQGNNALRIDPAAYQRYLNLEKKAGAPLGRCVGVLD